MEPNIVYTFTPDEFRVVQDSYSSYLNVLRVIAAIHRIEGNVSITPDGKGLMSAGSPVLSPAPNGGGMMLAEPQK